MLWLPSLNFATLRAPARAGGSLVLPLHSRIVFEGDSITAGSSGPQFSMFALIRAMGRFFSPSGWNQGVGGQTAAQMATQVANVTALNPKVVVLLCGTNDLSGTADTAATIFANIRTCVDAYRAAGAKVVSVCVLPRNDGVWDAGEETRRLALNDLIRAQVDVTVVDVESTFNPTTMCLDGLHPNYRGAIHLGNAVGDALNTLIVGDSVLTGYDTADNFLIGASENPQLTGTGGAVGGTPTPTGQVANNWTVDHNDTTLTVVASKTTLNGRTAQRVQVSGNAAGASPRGVTFRNTVAYSGQAGEFYEVWWDMSLAAGATGLRYVAPSTDTAMMQNIGAFEYPNDVAVAGVIRPPMTNALAGVDTSVSIQVALGFTGAGGAVAADITLAAPYYRKVPVGQ